MKEDPIQWYASLYGTESELQQLCDFFNSSKCQIVKRKEPHEGYYLTACRFSNLPDERKVCESAKKLLTLIRAFAKIERKGDFQSINIGSGHMRVESDNVPSIIKIVDGKQYFYLFPKTIISTISVLDPTVIIQDEDRDISPQKPRQPQKLLPDYYLNRCDDRIDSNVLDALYYFAQETSFYSLYKIYETIKIDVDRNLDPTKGKMLNARWTTEDEIRDFRYSAHCYDVVRNAKGLYGGSGRHSRAECDRKIQTRERAPHTGSILDLPEAESFIRHILEKWLDSKRPATT